MNSEIASLKSEIKSLTDQVNGHTSTINEKEKAMKELQDELGVKQHTEERFKDMDNLMHGYKLEMAELKMENQDLT